MIAACVVSVFEDPERQRELSAHRRGGNRVDLPVPAGIPWEFFPGVAARFRALDVVGLYGAGLALLVGVQDGRYNGARHGAAQ